MHYRCWDALPNHKEPSSDIHESEIDRLLKLQCQMPISDNRRRVHDLPTPPNMDIRPQLPPQSRRPGSAHATESWNLQRYLKRGRGELPIQDASRQAATTSPTATLLRSPPRCLDSQKRDTRRTRPHTKPTN
ncbi:hypothetical protein YC2023_067087 [Brassica napus]